MKPDKIITFPRAATIAAYDPKTDTAFCVVPMHTRHILVQETQAGLEHELCSTCPRYETKVPRGINQTAFYKPQKNKAYPCPGINGVPLLTPTCQKGYDPNDSLQEVEIKVPNTLWMLGPYARYTVFLTNSSFSVWYRKLYVKAIESMPKRGTFLTTPYLLGNVYAQGADGETSGEVCWGNSFRNKTFMSALKEPDLDRAYQTFWSAPFSADLMSNTIKVSVSDTIRNYHPFIDEYGHKRPLTKTILDTQVYGEGDIDALLLFTGRSNLLRAPMEYRIRLNDERKTQALLAWAVSVENQYCLMFTDGKRLTNIKGIKPSLNSEDTVLLKVNEPIALV